MGRREVINGRRRIIYIPYLHFTCDVGYLCANFSLPRPLCSRLRPVVRDRETSTADRRQTRIIA